MPTTHSTSIPQTAQEGKTLNAMSRLTDRKRMSRGVARRIEELSHRDAESRALYRRRADRMWHCGTWMEAARMADGQLLVSRANWCRDRLCPMCAWRRSRRNSIALQRAVDYCRDLRPERRWVLITLTLPNVPADGLSDALTHLTAGWDLLRKRREVARCYVGGARNVEITYNAKDNTYHPHLHALMECCEDYYGAEYLTHDRLMQYWIESASAVGANLWANPKTGEVWVDCSIEPADKYSLDGGTEIPDGTRSGVKEVSKYILKHTPLLESPAEDLHELAEAVKGRRLTAYTGTIRKAMRALDISDSEDAMDDQVQGVELAVDHVILRWGEAGSAYYTETDPSEVARFMDRDDRTLYRAGGDK